MHLRRLWLHDFRSYDELDLDLAPGLTVVVGENGTGKTNLLEAAGFLSTLSSFRGTPTEAMIRNGADRSNIRGEVLVGDREVLLHLGDVAVAVDVDEVDYLVHKSLILDP